MGGECVFCREASSAGGRGIVCVICSMSAALQAHSPADDTHNSSSSCRRCFPAEDTLTLLHPAETPAGPGILATFETRSLSTSLKKVPAGAQVYCISRALHCIALHCFEL